MLSSKLRSNYRTSYDPYRVLGVTSKSSIEEINKAFKARALETHPDRKGGSKEAFQNLNQAYQYISSMKHGSERYPDRYAERSPQGRAKKMKEKIAGIITLSTITAITLISAIYVLIA